MNPLASPTNPTNARMRVGVVQATPPAQADLVWVVVDGAAIQAAYFTGYVPVPGDRVVVTQDGTDWFVLGGKSGYAGNLVVNPDYKVFAQAQVALSLPPYNWTHYRVSGTSSSIVCAALSSSLLQVVMLIGNSSAGAGDNASVSAAFPVTPGQTLTTDVPMTLSIGGAATLTVTSRLAFQENATDAYPTFVSEATTGTATTTTSTAAWLTGTAVVPTGVTYARFVIRSVNSGNTATVLAGISSVRAI